MIHKRPFVDDDSYEVACKHRRHLEHIDQLAPMAFLDDSHPKTTTSDDDNILSNCQHIGRVGGSNTSSNQLDKSNPQVVLAQSSSPSILVHDGYEERLTGVCVIPMPDLEASVTHCCEGTKTDCSCLDQGSIECVKQHIMEARQKLRENLGEEMFDGLGFYDMGEDVGKKWTEEEEQLFHDVVLSTLHRWARTFGIICQQCSLAKQKGSLSVIISMYSCFGDVLSRIVESLSGKDASAYYQEDHAEDCNEHIEDEDEDEIGASKESADDDVRRVATDEEYEGDIDDISEAYVGISNNACGGDGGFELFKGIPSNEGDDFDIENDSCTSYECQRENVESSGPLHVVTDGRHSGQE
ncbi:hypothetical protein GH714_031637 [Hevea brasiliensis]|uniref:ELM2 domain-containing protein n=1 Tax=Hevea brasiliensis TaxID=3981 RepID=A0A6A6LD28_HEVBR|nr:hypothetical protein GH714_031637 [Hevea brasiliensis]